MKKFMLLVMVVISLVLVACGKGSTDVGDKSDISEQQNNKLIKASQLLTVEDASRILDVTMAIDEQKRDVSNPSELGSLSTKYVTVPESYLFVIVDILQDDTLDSTNEDHKLIIDTGGIRSYNTSLKDIIGLNEFDLSIYDNAISVDGLGEWAYIWNNDNITIAYKDYNVSVYIYNFPKGTAMSDEARTAWKIEKLTETGKAVLLKLTELSR